MKTDARLDDHDAEILAQMKRHQEEGAARYLSRATPPADDEERTPCEQRAADLGVGEVVLAWSIIIAGTAFVAACVYLIFTTLFRD